MEEKAATAGILTMMEKTTGENGFNKEFRKDKHNRQITCCGQDFCKKNNAKGNSNESKASIQN